MTNEFLDENRVPPHPLARVAEKRTDLPRGGLTHTTRFGSLGGSRGNIGYRVVQQQPTGLDDDDDDDGGERPETAESSDDERAGYPTFPVDGVGSRPSVNSLRRVSLRAHDRI